MEVQRIQGNKNILEKEKQSWRTQHLLISKLTAAAAAAAAKLLQSCLTLSDKATIIEKVWCWHEIYV